MRAALCGSLVLVQLVGFFGSAQGEEAKLSPEEARRELQKIEDELKETLGKKQNVSRDLKTLSKERARLNKLLIDTAATIKRGEGELTRLEGRLEELAEQEQLIRGSINDRHETISDLLTVMQRIGRQPPPVMATHRDDALKMVRSAMLLGSVFPPLKAQAERLTLDLGELIRITGDIRSKAADLKKRNISLEKDRIKIKAVLDAKRTRILKSQTALNSIRELSTKLKKNEADLATVIKRLDKEVAEKAALGEYEKKLAKLKEDIKSGKVLEIAPAEQEIAMVTPGRIEPAVRFSRTKGLLPLPVQGKRISDFGYKDELGRVFEGVRMQTRTKAQITSPCDGWIVYTGKFRSLGQLLIINAGGGYHVLLAGMGQIDVEEGQFVVAGEPVAVMGAKPNTRKNGKTKAESVLYIEFRKNGSPIDPDPWWAASVEKAQG